MTKILLVVRHAQSAGKQSGQRDYDRILTPAGEKNAQALGKKIKQQSFHVDLILASAAARAAQTVQYLNQSLELPAGKIQLNPQLYDALMVQWLDVIQTLPEENNVVMLVGHNPWISMLAGYFAGRSFDLAPCELAGFELGIESWKDVSAEKVKIINRFSF